MRHLINTAILLLFVTLPATGQNNNQPDPVGSKNSADLYLQAISTLLILRFSQLQPLQCPRFIGRIGRLSILTLRFHGLAFTVFISSLLPYSTASFSMGITASSALLLLPWRWPLLE